MIGIRWSKATSTVRMLLSGRSYLFTSALGSLTMPQPEMPRISLTQYPKLFTTHIKTPLSMQTLCTGRTSSPSFSKPAGVYTLCVRFIVVTRNFLRKPGIPSLQPLCKWGSRTFKYAGVIESPETCSHYSFTSSECKFNPQHSNRAHAINDRYLAEDNTLNKRTILIVDLLPCDMFKKMDFSSVWDSGIQPISHVDENLQAEWQQLSLESVAKAKRPASSYRMLQLVVPISFTHAITCESSRLWHDAEILQIDVDATRDCGTVVPPPV